MFEIDFYICVLKFCTHLWLNLLGLNFRDVSVAPYQSAVSCWSASYWHNFEQALQCLL